MVTTANSSDERIRRLNELLDQVLSTGALYRVDIRIKGAAGRPMVDVFVDGDDGVTVDQCAEVSRALAAAIELEGMFSAGFRLDVSSPGLGQPLRLPRQYRRHVGRKLEVHVFDVASDAPVTVIGKLLEAEVDRIVLEAGDQQKEFSFDRIKKAVVKPAF